MNKIFITLVLVFCSFSYAKVEVLDRIAIIVDDGVVMESQVNNTVRDITRRYEEQNLQKPPIDVIKMFDFIIYSLNFFNKEDIFLSS